MDKSLVGASVREMCEWGDKQILEETSKVFKKEKDLKKGLLLGDKINDQCDEFVMFSGIAFPTCISVNNCICHYSPVASETDYLLKDEDLVKM